ncbi:MAG: ABC transporter permease [Longimicrobiales bacterium]
MTHRDGPRSLHGDRPHVGELPVADDVDRELRSHLALRAEELEAEGWEPAAARAEAARRFGDLETIRRDCESLARRRDRRLRRTHGWEAAMQDVRYAIRSLARSPGFALVALLTLALGIGANTAIYGVVHGVLLRPLPYPDADRIVTVAERGQRGGRMSVAWANFRDWNAENTSFEALGAHNLISTTVLGGQEPLRILASRVSEDFWRVMGTRPVIGRLTGPEEHREGAAGAVVVTRGLAQRLFGTPDAVGRPVEAGGVSATVVGVLADADAYPAGAEAWFAVEVSPQGDSRTAHNWSVVGRLADGVGMERAREELDALTERILAGEPESDAAYLADGVWVTDLREAVVGDARRPLLLLLGAAACVLLVACTNLASTLLARGTVRAREFAVRSSLGADRSRLIRQLLTESAVLAGAGALLGLGFAWLLLRGIRILAADVPRIDGVGLSLPVLGFTAAVAVITAVAFGLLPSLRLTDGGQAGTLRAGTRGSSAGRNRVWGVLVATEVALALMLLMGSGLLIRSFSNVLAQDPGVETDDVLVSSVALNRLRYVELQDHARFYDELLPRLEALPGVESAGVLTALPVSGGIPTGRVQLDGDPSNHADSPAYVVASRGAFDALDIPLIRGRLFDERDGPDATHAIVVSQSFVDRWWPDVDPIGRQVSGGGMDNYWNADPPVFGTVVGVVGDVRWRDLTSDADPTVYWNYAQRPARIAYGTALLLEAEGEPGPLAGPFRIAVGEADSDIAVEVRFLRDQVAGSVAERRFMLMVLGGFAGLALLLAAVGIYGVVSYTVARRTREMGIRLALGAEPSDVRGIVLRGALGMVVVGLAAGLVGSVALSRVLEAFLYDVSSTDPVTFAVVPAVLLCTAVAATWIPALRSTRVDPIETMRAE